MGPGRTSRAWYFHSPAYIIYCQISEEKEKERPVATTTEKVKETAKKDDPMREKSMYDEDDSDDEKVRNGGKFS